MSRITSVELVSDNELSKYYNILYDLNFIEEILEQKPEKCLITDDSELWHFQVEEEKLKNSLFYRYGYEVKNTDIKICELLAECKRIMQVQIPKYMNAFWAIPNKFCVSHSHPAKDVFKIEKYVKSIVEADFDIIIELTTKERGENNPFNSLFAETLLANGKNAIRYAYINQSADIDEKEIDNIIAKIDKKLLEGKRILLHSQGRTESLGLVLACWLVKHNLADANNFIDVISLLRRGGRGHKRDADGVMQFNSDFSSKTVPFYFSKNEIKSSNYSIPITNKISKKVDKETLQLIKSYMNNDGK